MYIVTVSKGSDDYRYFLNSLQSLHVDVAGLAETNTYMLATFSPTRRLHQRGPAVSPAEQNSVWISNSRNQPDSIIGDIPSGRNSYNGDGKSRFTSKQRKHTRSHRPRQMVWSYFLRFRVPKTHSDHSIPGMLRFHSVGPTRQFLCKRIQSFSLNNETSRQSKKTIPSRSPTTDCSLSRAGTRYCRHDGRQRNYAIRHSFCRFH